MAAPAGYLAGGLLGGQAGAALGAGTAKFLDNKLHGDSWTHSLGQGALNAGIYGIGGPALGHLKEAFGGAKAAGDVAGAFTPSSAAGLGSGELGAGAADAAYGSAAGGGGFLSGTKSAGSWLASHPQAVSGALQGAGQIGQMGSENAMRKAQTTSIDLNNQQSQYEMEAKKRRDAALAPLLAAFQGMIQSQMAHPSQVAKNPYV